MAKSKINQLKLLLSKDGRSFIDPTTKKEIPHVRMFPLNTRYAVNVSGMIYDSFSSYELVNQYKVDGHYFVDIEFKGKPGGIPFLAGEVVLSTFNDKYLVGDKFTYNTSSRKCCLKNLKHLPAGKTKNYSQVELSNWDCQNKANYANNRVLGISATNFSITQHDVFDCLQRASFRCAYCGESLFGQKWHLDHINPISKRGANDRMNITPACVDCNLMKHSMNVDSFFAKIQKIVKNINLRNTGRYELLNLDGDVDASFNRVYLIPSEIL